MLIRPERPEEFPFLHDLVKTAFETADVSNGMEQDFVDMLRESVNYIPKLALVAEVDGKPVGHIMFTRTYLSTSGGRFEALLLAPLAVMKVRRNEGTGFALITEGMNRAREMGFTSVFLVGDPDYYARFGFRTAASYGIRHNDDIPEEYVMACELVPDALKGVHAMIDII